MSEALEETPTPPLPSPPDRGGAPLPPPSERIRALEGMLFASPGPVKLTELAEACGWEKELVERDLERLVQTLEGRGIELQKVAGSLRLVTVPEVAPYIERMLKIQTRRRLSRAQLETLAVIAYQQPVTRAQIEAHRGVSCDRTLQQLADLQLVRETGRAEVPGRPILYGTSSDFLRHFGLNSLDELPALDSASEKPAAEAAPEPLRRAAMQPIAEELAGEPSSGLRKLLNRIRGKSGRQEPS
ncbi:MAG: SMC-Scp complex subunit ScpB [Armatimonadetes bacterium]|nr:SMC-Scp complex subunit ScpB [Armatimonadota bacterium]